MANLIETSQWEDGIYQFEETDFVQGGQDGIDNVPMRQLANRTKYLKNLIDGSLVRYLVHIQGTSSNSWEVVHNLGISKIPIIRAYAETTEPVVLGGYCGAGNYCGDGITCGGDVTVNVPVYTEIAIASIRLRTINILDIRFAAAQTGKAVIHI